MTKAVIIALAILFVVVPHAVLIGLAVRKFRPVKRARAIPRAARMQ